MVLSAWLLLDGGTIRIVWPQIWLVAVTGVFGTLATLSLFAALALGPIAIVAPIVGSYPALAMIFAVAQGARPSAGQWLAIGAVMAGVAIVSRSGGRYEASGELPPGTLKTLLGDEPPQAPDGQAIFALPIGSKRGARGCRRPPAPGGGLNMGRPA